MADSFIALDEPSTVDKKLDTEQLTVGANTVERERVQLAGAAATEIAKASNAAPGAADHGVVTRPLAPVEGAGAVTARTPRVTLASDDPAVASLAVLDDWDESDRAKVNPIAGQAGVAAGAGAVGANTQRMTLASDDPAVASLSVLDDWDNAASDGASVSGDVAHDAADAGEPVKIGGVASRARRTAISADGDRVNGHFDRYGRQVTVVGTDVTVSASQLTASGDTNLLAAGGAGNRYKVLRVEASNSHATTALTVGLKSASINAGAVFGKKYLPAAGGQAVWVFPQGYLLGGANEAFIGNLSAAGQVEFTIYYEVVTD